MTEKLPPCAARPFHGGYLPAKRAPSNKPIMLQMAQAEEQWFTHARRLIFLRRYFAIRDLHFADRDGPWSITSFLKYDAEANGLTDEWAAEIMRDKPEPR